MFNSIGLSTWFSPTMASYASPTALYAPSTSPTSVNRCLLPKPLYLSWRSGWAISFFCTDCGMYISGISGFVCCLSQFGRAFYVSWLFHAVYAFARALTGGLLVIGSALIWEMNHAKTGGVFQHRVKQWITTVSVLHPYLIIRH